MTGFIAARSSMDGGASDVERDHPSGGPACSAGSRLRDEDLTATASLGRRWLLVEVAGAWGWSAFTQSPALDPAIGRAVVRRAEAAGMRVLAIRRPGRRRGTPRWRWAVVDTLSASAQWGEADSAEALLGVPLDGSTGTPATVPIFAVCAHGRHDECCAVRGRGVAAELASAYPDETWECSHVGGDRFAATMIVFPHGLNYGRVDDLDPVAIAAAYRDGRIHDAGYRGRVAYTHLEQAALAAVAAELGDDRLDAHRPVGTRELSHPETSDTDGAPHTWRVAVETADRVVEVDLAEDTTGPLFTTCGATVPVAIRRYRVVSTVV